MGRDNNEILRAITENTLALRANHTAIQNIADAVNLVHHALLCDYDDTKTSQKCFRKRDHDGDHDLRSYTINAWQYFGGETDDSARMEFFNAS